MRNYVPTQSATILVPSEGLTGKQANIGFQVPRRTTYRTLKTIISSLRSISIDEQACQVATTIRAKGKTLEDGIQGIERSIVTLNGVPAKALLDTWQWNKPFYFSIMMTKTWPFSSGKTETSAEGGVLIYNLPPSDVPYKLSAIKDGEKFSTVEVLCKPGAFINAAPPHSPTQL